jgi:MoaA/NifB/PqqE/SkfB family radical SAM enzyme
MKIFLTNLCNLNCVYCFKDKRKKEPSFEEILVQIKKSRKKVLFKGGEPLERKDILEILKHTKSRGLKIEIETNAFYLNEKIIDLVDEIHLVFDSVIFGDWKKTTRSSKKVFDKSLRNIKLASRMGKKIYLNALLTSINLNSLQETKDFCDKYGITLRIFENPPVKGFEESNRLFVPIERAKFLGKGVIYKKSKPKAFNKEKIRFRKNRLVK